jgi:predicted homoserine dehydrogenase-like protein
MIVIDKALEKLEKDGRPIRVGLVGFGFAGQGFAMQLLEGIKGMRLVAISNRTLKNTKKGLKILKVKKFNLAKTQKELDQFVTKKILAVSLDYKLLTSSKNIDVIVEATGEVEFGAKVSIDAIKGKKHLVLINAELDATLGPILKRFADQAGVMYTQADGDQPAVLMRIFRYVSQMGFKPVMVGNIKSLIDARRTPKTQAAFAKAHFQRPKMITSFADGSKIAFEMATIANATSFPVSKRGMQGPRASRVEDAIHLFDKKQMLKTGITDYILGAEPSFGVFVIAYSKNPLKRRYMKIYKMGDGPFYTFYTHCHLSPIEAPISVAQTVIFKDPTLAPIGEPICDVITLAKKDLKKGEVLDGIGGFICYGAIENYKTSIKQKLLPLGLSEGCILKRDIKMDSAIVYDDVILPENRLADRLRDEQTRVFKFKKTIKKNLSKNKVSYKAQKFDFLTEMGGIR